MVFFIFLGLLDVFFAVIMLLTQYGVLHSWRLAIAAAFFWVAKAIMYRGSFLSVVDFCAGLYILLVMFGVNTPLSLFFLGIMVYKLVVSLVLRG